MPEEVKEVSIRLVKPTSPDVAKLLAALDAYQTALYPASNLYLLPAEQMMGERDRFLGAYAGDVLVGCCGLVIRPGGYGELKRLYVRPKARGRGIATRLLAGLERHARETGLTLLRLETGISQPYSIQTCERAGFTRCERFGDYAGDPISVFMEKRLEIETI